MDPGVEKMMELEKMQRMRARLPPPKDVARALTDFFGAKKKQKRALEDTQAQLAIRGLRYCLGAEKEQVTEAGAEADRYISEGMWPFIAKVLQLPPQHVSEAHIELTQMVYEVVSEWAPRRMVHGLQAYCVVLCRAGRPETAYELLVQRSPIPSANEKYASPDAREAYVEVGEDTVENAVEDAPPASFDKAWLIVLEGFAQKQDAQGVSCALAAMRERGIGNHSGIAAIMLRFSVGQGDMPMSRKWWEEYVHMNANGKYWQHNRESATRAADVIGALLRWCIQSDNLDFGHEVVRVALKSNPPKPIWDVIFVWASGTGKGVDEIGRMLDVMQDSNAAVQDREQWRIPDAASINALVEFAISKGDPYMAERFITLGRDRGIEPDSRTYVLQMNYRLSVNDVDGALTAYKNLQAMDLSDDQDLPAVNRLVVALCGSKRHDFDTIMNVAADLSDRRARFEPLTVSTLCLLHLSRDETHDVIDLLNTHAFHYSSTERTGVRDAIVSYSIDPATSTPRSWDAYSIIRNVFDELSREPRTDLMSNFFKRERPDMAVHIFNHMRTHSRADTIPTIDTYVAAFMGTARLHDIESLEVVHNQLKLDYNINIDTHLRNALVIAYTACNRPRKALGFWDDIVASREGPSYNSIHIALRACEKSPFGDLKAKEIWEKLRKMNVELDSTMWASYVAALAGNGDVKTAIKTLEDAEARSEVDVDAFVLGSLFAGSPGYVKQGEVEGWAKARYPQAWKDLEKTGMEEDEAGTRMFGVDRSVTP